MSCATNNIEHTVNLCRVRGFLLYEVECIIELWYVHMYIQIFKNMIQSF